MNGLGFAIERYATRMPPMDVAIRYELRPGDIGNVVLQHGVLYAREHGFDPTFEAYVAGPIAEFVLHPDRRARLWIAEAGGQFCGCIAIVGAVPDAPGAHVVPVMPDTAQLRWFLVTPAARGRGIGKELLTRAVEFSRACGYRSILLWTASALADAARLYRAAGFTLAESTPARRWGVDVVEEKYTLTLDG